MRPEPLADKTGLRMIRRAADGGKYYFLLNGDKPIDQWATLGADAMGAAIMDPVTGQTGLAKTQKNIDGNTQIYLQLAPGAALILRTFATVPPQGSKWAYHQTEGSPVELKGIWNVKFTQGGPTLPPPVQTEQLASWTKLGGDQAQAFAGMALYTLNFDAPAQSAAHYSLDLGNVCASARVKLNGKDLGTVFVKPFRVPVEGLKPQGNVLEVEVTGTSANRIRDLDVRKVPWKIFYDTNIVTVNYRPFDASGWPIADQGLLGPVTLQPEKEIAVDKEIAAAP